MNLACGPPLDCSGNVDHVTERLGSGSTAILHIGRCVTWRLSNCNFGMSPWQGRSFAVSTVRASGHGGRMHSLALHTSATGVNITLLMAVPPTRRDERLGDPPSVTTVKVTQNLIN